MHFLPLISSIIKLFIILRTVCVYKTNKKFKTDDKILCYLKKIFDLLRYKCTSTVLG